MSRKHRIPGMAATQSFAIPRCSQHLIPMQRNDQNEWVCIECFDHWLRHDFLGGRTLGGVELPDNVKDERQSSIRELMPNRRYRRQVLRERKTA